MALMLFILIPFSPMLSFLFYAFHHGNSSIVEWIAENPICRFSKNPYKHERDISEFRKWMDEKLDKHLGFMYVYLY